MAVLTRGGRRRRDRAGVHHRRAWSSAAIPDFLLGGRPRLRLRRHLGWLPVAGRGRPDSYVLPVLALAIGPAAVLARIVRVETLGVLQADYMRTARAKRLPAR